ncbi:sensor domain-containing protein [Actinoplanes sp. NPDC024001]|uniref:sensor histidine kinase n=1 Tax=Actinoplanes sp. NPDC024001 TaxID=3154598 RepID=UPI0033C9CC22
MTIARMLRAPVEGRTWRPVGYALISMLLAAPAFLLALLGLVASVLSVLTIGLPFLVGVLWLLRHAGRYFRVPARLVLGWDWPSPARRPTATGPVRWATAVLRDVAGWRALLYCLLKLPLSLLTVHLGYFTVAGLAAMTYPAWWTPARDVFGVESVATAGQAWAVAAAGLAAALASPWLIRLCTGLDRLLIRALLEPDPAQARIAQLEAGRAALQADAAAVLRRVERDLHDGTQARLVALAVSLSQIERRTGDEVRPLIRDAQDNITEALAELRDIIRAVHPPALDDGLPTALQTLAARSSVPVDLSVELAGRPSDAVASALYFTVAELLTNVARHARATRVTVALRSEDDIVRLSVRDDGRGGARPRPDGTGLAGLHRRATALDGSLTVDSPAGGPTTITMTLPGEQ